MVAALITALKAVAVITRKKLHRYKEDETHDMKTALQIWTPEFAFLDRKRVLSTLLTY